MVCVSWFGQISGGDKWGMMWLSRCPYIGEFNEYRGAGGKPVILRRWLCLSIGYIICSRNPFACFIGMCWCGDFTFVNRMGELKGTCVIYVIVNA